MFFLKVIQAQMIVNFVFANYSVGIFFYSDFERDYFSGSNSRMRLIVTDKINK
jgi:hypothetical protein